MKPKEQKVVTLRLEQDIVSSMKTEKKLHGFLKDAETYKHMLREFQRLHQLEQQTTPEAPTSPFSTPITRTHYVYLVLCRGFHKEKLVTLSVCQHECSKPCQAKELLKDAMETREFALRMWHWLDEPQTVEA